MGWRPATWQQWAFAIRQKLRLKTCLAQISLQVAAFAASGAMPSRGRLRTSDTATAPCAGGRPAGRSPSWCERRSYRCNGALHPPSTARRRSRSEGFAPIAVVRCFFNTTTTQGCGSRPGRSTGRTAWLPQIITALRAGFPGTTAAPAFRRKKPRNGSDAALPEAHRPRQEGCDVTRAASYSTSTGPSDR